MCDFVLCDLVGAIEGFDGIDFDREGDGFVVGIDRVDDFEVGWVGGDGVAVFGFTGLGCGGGFVGQGDGERGGIHPRSVCARCIGGFGAPVVERVVGELDIDFPACCTRAAFGDGGRTGEDLLEVFVGGDLKAIDEGGAFGIGGVGDFEGGLEGGDLAAIDGRRERRCGGWVVLSVDGEGVHGGPRAL